MRKFIFILGLCFVAVLQVTLAQAKPLQSTLHATVSAERPTVSELEAYALSLSFAIVNTGKRAADSHVADSRLFINKQEIKDWNPYMNGSRVLESGMQQSFSVLLPHHFKKPGIYEVIWKGDVFQSQPLKIKVLRDRVMPAGKEPKVFAFVRALRAQLPSGWGAYSETQYVNQSLTIVRLQPTQIAQPVVPNDNPFRERTPDPIYPFEFSLWIEPFVAPTNYPQIKIDNETIRQKLIALSRHMKNVPTAKGQYFPKTPEDKKQVEEYERLKKTLRKIPEYYFRDISLSFFNMNWQSDKHSYLRVHDKAVREECREVTQRVINLLSSYEPQEPLPSADEYDED